MLLDITIWLFKLRKNVIFTMTDWRLKKKIVEMMD